MMHLGLTAQERGAYEDALRSSHSRRIEIDVLTLDGDHLSDVSARLLDGQVNVDDTADVTRSATLSFQDPWHAINFDTDSPDNGALFADRMIRVRYGVHVESLSRYVWADVFVGPVTKLSREDDVVNVEAQGKESLVKGSVWRPLTLKKGARIVDALRTLMRDRGGESRFDFPDVPARLPKTRSLDRLAEIWTVAQSLARSVNRQLFYDGRGVLILRERPQRVVYTFRDGLGGDVLGPLAIDYELGDDVKNVVEVKGQPPKGKKERIRGVAVAPPAHPLSPQRLGRRGAPRFLVEVVEDNSIRSDAAAHRRAEDLLEDRLRETVNVSFDSLPVPHLDPGDLVRVKTDDAAFTFRLRQYAIPLTPDGSPVMPVGYLKKVTPPRRHHRHRRRRHSR